MARLPYPGLRAFRRDESDLFFGRDEEIDTILDRLLENRFLAVLGASGSGKSSLVRTGLLDALHGGFNPYGTSWRIADFHPGGDPIENLAAALNEASERDPGDPDPIPLTDRLRHGPRSIVEWCEDGHLKPGSQLLIVADQFEELFNYGGQAAQEDAHILASLLVECARSEDRRIFVVLTMRSDYFGACGTFPDLAEQISTSLFLTPRMLRGACREAITLPSTVEGFTIDDPLVNRLLNDMESFAPFGSGDAEPARAGRQADQLPLMQYALNSMWQVARRKRGSENLHLDLDDYGTIKGLEGALDNHGDQVIRKLNLPEERIERVFRALVRGPSLELATRDPHTFPEIAAISGLPRNEVEQIVAAFAAEECQFLRVDPPDRRRRFVDISHESLIRQWGHLSDWLVKEAQAADTWRSLAADAADWKTEGRPDEALLGGMLLLRRREWWNSQRPTAAWAARYPLSSRLGEEQVPLELVEDFLDASDSYALRQEQKRRRQKQRLQLTGAAAAMAITAASMTWAVFADRAAASDRDRAIERQDAFERQYDLNVKLQRERNKALAAQERAEHAAKGAAAAARTAELSAASERTAKLAAETAAATARLAAHSARQASAAMYATIEQNLIQLSAPGADMQRPAAVTREQAQQLFGQLTTKTEAHPSRSESELTALAALTASEAAVAGVGVNFAPPEAAGFIERHVAQVPSTGVPASVTARTDLLKGKAQELRGSAADFSRAATLYASALRAADQARDPAAKSAGFEAAAAWLRLHRRLGVAAIPREVGDRCDEPEPPQAQSIEFLPYLECRATLAEFALNQGNVDAANSIIGSASRQLSEAGTNGSEYAPAGKSLAHLRLHVLLGDLSRRAGRFDASLGGGVDREAKRYAELNPRTEEGSALYAATLDSSDTAGAVQARLPILEAGGASTGYLLDSLPVLSRHQARQLAETSSEAVSADESIFVAERAVGVLHTTGHIVHVLRDLKSRGAPDPALPVDGRTRLHDAWLRDAESDVDEQAAGVNRLILQAANRNRLLTDLNRVPNPYLSSEDRAQIQEVANVLSGYREVCTSGSGAAGCDAQFDKISQTLLPMLRQPLPAQGQAQSAPTTESQPWFGGYDLVADTEGLPMRGSLSLPLEWQGRRLLFATDDNRVKFEQSPASFVPRFGGAAIEWLEIGEIRQGNARLSCPATGQVYFYATQKRYDASCGVEAAEGNAARDLKAAELQWTRLGRPASPAVAALTLIEPAPAAAGKTTGTHSRQYTLPPGATIVAPAGGMIRTLGGTISITHADGSSSLLMLSGGRFVPIPSGTMRARGTELKFQPSSESTPLSLRWSFRPSSSSPSPRAPLEQLLKTPPAT